MHIDGAGRPMRRWARPCRSGRRQPRPQPTQQRRHPIVRRPRDRLVGGASDRRVESRAGGWGLSRCIIAVSEYQGKQQSITAEHHHSRAVPETDTAGQKETTVDEPTNNTSLVDLPVDLKSKPEIPAAAISLTTSSWPPRNLPNPWEKVV